MGRVKRGGIARNQKLVGKVVRNLQPNMESNKVVAFRIGDSTTLFVSSETESQLKCFRCNDASLYHDAAAWWNAAKDDLVCPSCYDNLDQTEGYTSVITFH